MIKICYIANLVKLLMNFICLQCLFSKLGKNIQSSDAIKNDFSRILFQNSSGGR